MMSFAGFLVETLFASVILVTVGVTGIKLMANHLLSRDLEVYKMRLKEESERETALLRAGLERAASEAAKPVAAPQALVLEKTERAIPAPFDKRAKATARLFRLFDSATLSIVRFALEFRAEKLDAADEAARIAVEKTSRLANFVRLSRRHFPQAVADSIEASALPLAELAWRSYRVFKDPNLSEKQTLQEIEGLNAKALDLGRQIETVKAELTRLLETAP